MTKTEAILEIKKKIKALLSVEPNTEVTEVEVKLYSTETMDGQKLEVEGDGLMVEAPIYMIDENGNRNICPDGEYMLSDGNTIMVNGGVVSEISTQTEEQSDSEAIVENPVEAESSVETKINELESKVQELTSLLSTLVNETESISNKLTELSNQPAAQTMVFERTLSQDELRIERIKQIREGLKK